MFIYYFYLSVVKVPWGSGRFQLGFGSFPAGSGRFLVLHTSSLRDLAKSKT